MNQNFIRDLKSLKNGLESGEYTQETAFFEGFEALFTEELRHNDCETESDFDWRTMTDVHLALIYIIEGCHQQEEVPENQMNVSVTFSVEEALKGAAEGRRGHQIYLLDQADTHYDVVGDLHGDPTSLMEIVRRSGIVDSFLQNRPHRMVFMGDYVDRGKGHLSLLSRLLALKYCFSERLFLLRGNHDGGVLEGPRQVKLPYSKPENEPDEDYFPTYLLKLSACHSETEPLLEAYLNFFDTLGMVAMIRTGNIYTMAVHGGVPRPLWTEEGYFTYLENLAMLSDSTHLDPFGRKMTQNLMWSDPYSGTGDLREGMGRFFFTEEQFLDFIETVGVHQMLRGHQWMEEGYRSHFENKLYTIFSSGQWPERPPNEMTAYPKVKGRWARISTTGDIEIYPKEKTTI